MTAQASDRSMARFLILAMLVIPIVARSEFFALPAQAQQNGRLLFIENVGQFKDPVRFRLYSGQSTLTLTDDAIWLTVLEPSDADQQVVDGLAAGSLSAPGSASQQGVNLKFDFVGANPQARPEPFNRLETHVSYFRSNDPANWQIDIPVWGGIRYVDLYPGLDLEITSQNGHLVQRLVVQDDVVTAAGAEVDYLNDIRLRVTGAESLAVDQTGRLLLGTAIGRLTLPLWQVTTSGQTPIDTSLIEPAIDDSDIIAPFAPPSEALAVAAATPGLIYATFLGGSGPLDTVTDLTVDRAGHAYVTGLAYPGFPTTPGAFDTSLEGVYSEAFVVKLSPDGSRLSYATFLGGSDYDVGQSIEVDQDGYAYVAGYTSSPDFPTTPGTLDDSLGDGSDAFVVKLNPTGTDLSYATFLGGNEIDFGWGLAIDENGYAYVTGYSQSSDFPLSAGAFDDEQLGGEAYVVKLNPTGSELVYATFVGGNRGDYGYGLAVDAAGYAYLAGYTTSTDFPTTPDAFSPTYTADADVFVVKLAPDAGELVYGTYVGGSLLETAQAIAIDESGHAYVTGFTESGDFPTTPDAFAPTCEACVGGYPHLEAYVFKVTPDGSDLIHSSYLGGSEPDYGYDIAVDDDGYAYVGGYTTSADFPTTPGAFDSTCEGCETGYDTDAFVARVNPAGTGLAYATYLGTGDGYDRAYSLALDESDQIYVAGFTSSADFPVTGGAFDTELEGYGDGFVVRLALEQAEPPPEVPGHTCAPTPLGVIMVGASPRGLAVDSARQRVYVANYEGNSVSVIDSRTNTVLQTVHDIPAANGLAYDSTHNMLWVTSYDTDQLYPIQINADATAFTVRSPVGVGDGPWGLAYETGRQYLYVANSLADSITVVDTRPGLPAVAATLTGAFRRPFTVAANNVTGRVYVSNFDSHNVTVLEGASITRLIDLYDSAQPYGLAVDETRELVYVATVGTNRIVTIGPDERGPDQFLGWAAFYRGFGNRNRPVPLRELVINPDIGPAGDGGHLWTTTAIADGSETNQVLLIPKGWSSYFHYPLVSQAGANFAPEGDIAVDRSTQRVYVTSGGTPGTVTVLGDQAELCSGVEAADNQTGQAKIDFELFSLAALIEGDVNGDGRIDILDLAFIAANYGTDTPAADVDRDGKVDVFDLVTAANNFGRQIR